MTTYQIKFVGRMKEKRGTFKINATDENDLCEKLKKHNYLQRFDNVELQSVTKVAKDN